VPGEEQLFGHGISDCASCDGPMLRDAVAGVVGGGDSALLEALELTEFVSEVIVFHRGDSFRAQQVYQDRVDASPKITVRLGTEVVEVLGDDKVTGVRVRETGSNETSDVELAGLFVYVGGEPQTAFLDGVVELDEQGRVPTDTWMRTTQNGLYAAGSIRRDSAEQAVTAAGDGATAAVAVHRYLQGEDVGAPAAELGSTA
jgi:thioredoxin reductase (NADPH)